MTAANDTASEAPNETTPNGERTAPLILLALLVVGAAILGAELLQGWYPYDEGALGQSAERVLSGQLPHRDFDETYTGLLSYINAFAFRLLGASSVTLRVPLFAGALLWLWATYKLLHRFTPPAGAALVALAALVWGVPNYPAAMPSWYVLFVATGSALALVRWQEDRRARWLVGAGALGGIAFLFKLTGIFVLLGGFLALVLTRDESTGDAADAGDAKKSRGLPELTVAALLASIAFGLAAVAGRGGQSEFLRFVVPVSVLALAGALHALAPQTGTAASRWRALADRLLPYAVGVLIPVLIAFAWYAARGGGGALINGVFVTPFRRVAFAAFRPPALASLLFALPLAFLLWTRSTGRAGRVALPTLAMACTAFVLYRSGADPRWYQIGWFSAWALLFFVAIEGALNVDRRAPADAPATDASRAPRPAQAVTLACIAVAIALVEYPFASPIYTLYSLPLVLVAATALVRRAGRVAPRVQVVLAFGFLAFGLLRILPGTPNNLGLVFARSTEDTPLELTRGGLRVTALDAVVHEEVVSFVLKTAAGRAIWAGPDAPEIYFYSGLPNRTRTLFDFLDSPDDAATPLLDRLRALDVGVVVLKLRPPFSPALSPETLEALRRAYPHQRGFPGYIVLWS